MHKKTFVVLAGLLVIFVIVLLSLQKSSGVERYFSNQNKFVWETEVRVREDYQTRLIDSVYGLEEIEEKYQVVENYLGKENVRLVKFVGYDDETYKGFKLLLTDNGKELLPYGTEEHQKFQSDYGYLLSYSGPLYIGPNSVPVSDDQLGRCDEGGDCILVKSNCCASCLSLAINYKFKKYWDELMYKKCDDVNCTLEFEMCSDKKISCVNNRCEIGL